MTDVPLHSIFSKSLESASQASNLPTADQMTQELIRRSLNELRHLNSRIIGTSLFSPNEILEDISTRDLVYLLADYVTAEVQSRIKTDGPQERLQLLAQTQILLKRFLANSDDYGIVPETERALYQQKASAITDPTKRREFKIKQYQKGKELRARIDALRKRRRLSPIKDNNDFELIASLLPSPSVEADEEDPETEEILREAVLLTLRLMYGQADAQLGSIDQEMELLRNIPSPAASEAADNTGLRDERETDNMWRLDSPRQPLDQGTLLDNSGKPLRPFTILPSNAADRARLQARVFQPGHRLPTMTIDEYLETERQRGNILTGGGAASAAAPTSSEKLALESEQGGTVFAEEKAEEKRQKDESWARYTDEHPRGAGNTMNRG